MQNTATSWRDVHVYGGVYVCGFSHVYVRECVYVNAYVLDFCKSVCRASYSCSLCLRSASASSELRSMEALSQLSITHVMEAQGASLGREQGREGSGRGVEERIEG